MKIQPNVNSRIIRRKRRPKLVILKFIILRKPQILWNLHRRFDYYYLLKFAAFSEYMNINLNCQPLWNNLIGTRMYILQKWWNRRRGGAHTPSDLGGSVNPISTKLGRLCSPYYYCPHSKFLDLLPFGNTELQREPWRHDFWGSSM